jgi:hypothetical protein
MSGHGVIAQEPDQMCEMCGKIDECRPYGLNNEQICFDCAMATPKSKAIAEKKMAAYIFGGEE